MGHHLYGLIFQHASDGILLADASGCLLDVNPAACELLGYSRDELLELTTADLVDADERQRRTGVGTFVGAVAVRCRGGRLVEVESSTTRLPDGRSICVIRDLTERTRVGQALARTRRAQRVLGASRQVLLRATDEQRLLEGICGALVDVGAYVFAWIGVPEHDAGRTIRPVASAGRERGYLDQIRVSWGDDPEGRGPGGTAALTGSPSIARRITDPSFDPWREAASARGFGSALSLPLPNHGAPPFGILAIYAADADAFDADEVALLEDLVSDLDFGIQALRTQARHDRALAALEASEGLLRQSEARYRALFEAASDGILLLGDGVVIDANARAADLFGRPVDALRGAHLQELAPPDAPSTVHAWTTRFADNPRAVFPWRHRRADGSVFHAEIALSRLALDGRELLLAIVRDVTERAALEDQLRQAQKLEALGRLAGGIAHDFNNLLTAIIGSVRLLQRELAPTGVVAEDLSAIEDAGCRAAELTRQLLAFSRREPSSPSLVRLDELVARSGPLLRRLAGEELTVEILSDDDLRPVVADAGQLGQMLVNLVVNARDATPPGGRITVEARRVGPGHPRAHLYEALVARPHVALVVTDTGEGMDDATRARAFEPFFTTKEQGRGTGLGLAAVYGVVRDAQGFVDIDSAVGRGTTVSVFLPAGQEPAPVRAGPALPVAEGTGACVLVVEDEPAVRMVAARILEAAGFSVLQARDGLAALAVLEANHAVDVVLTDVVMPRLDGADLALQLAALRPDLPVVFMSGHGAERVAARGILDAVVVRKPFDRAALAAAVRGALDRR